MKASLLLAMAVAAVPAWSACAPPPDHAFDDLKLLQSRDRFGLAWYSEPVRLSIAFVPNAVALDASARDAVDQQVAAAQRLYADARLCAWPPVAVSPPPRLAYLRDLLARQDVDLRAEANPRCPMSSPGAAADGAAVELQLYPCD